MAPLIGLIGKKRVGKDTIAAFLVESHGFRRLAFADRLKEAALAVDPIADWDAEGRRLSTLVAEHGWESAKGWPEVRRFLQYLGVAVRTYVDDDAWVTPVLAEVRQSDTPTVITDVRFTNEASAIRAAGGILVRVVRPGVDDGDAHESETGLPDVAVDCVIHNIGAVSDLNSAAEEVARLARS